MMIDDLRGSPAGRHGAIPGLDFVELLRDSTQRDAVIVIAAEYHVAAAKPRLPQAVSQLSDARLNLMSELVRAHLQSRQLLLFVRHGATEGPRGITPTSGAISRKHTGLQR
jgi:hypothetical protein